MPAEVAEPVDAPVSKTGGGDSVWVRVPPSAPITGRSDTRVCPTSKRLIIPPRPARSKGSRCLRKNRTERGSKMRQTAYGYDPYLRLRALHPIASLAALMHGETRTSYVPSLIVSSLPEFPSRSVSAVGSASPGPLNRYMPVAEDPGASVFARGLKESSSSRQRSHLSS